MGKKENIKIAMEDSEKQFWELTKDDTHSKDDEIIKVLSSNLFLGKIDDDNPLPTCLTQLFDTVYNDPFK